MSDLKAYKHSWYLANKERLSARQKEYRAQNKERFKAYYAEWKEKNKDKLAANRARWAAKHPEKLKESKKAYERRNPKMRKGASARRRARRAKARPRWLSKEARTQIALFYRNCPVRYHVDHIIPLQGKNVCGLHVPWNLQYLLATENLRKGSKYGDDA